MTGITKSFGQVQALKGVQLDLRAGEVHALMGENGAGKSTLMKILTGIYEKDQGEILYKGKLIQFKKPKEAIDAGVVIVHQELNMINHISVAQNIFIGRETLKMGILIDDKDINQRATELFQMMKIDIDTREKVGKLTVGKQQMVEIAKAISMNANIIVFDEPTTALTDTEIDELFKIIAELKSKGIGIVYISHRMDEIGRITDRITVMRDGEYIATSNTPEISKEELINQMVGRVIYENPKQASKVAPDAPVVMEVKNLTQGNKVKDLSFELRKGEILGFAGLMGAGRTEMARLLFGADAKDSGEVIIKGKKITIKSPKDAVRHGIGYLSEDRNRYGIVVGRNVADNTVLASLEKFTNASLIDDKKIVKKSEEYVKLLGTKTPHVKQIAGNLSGGNRQKVVIAKWLERDCEILIFDEPTRGIDVGAKSEIYRFINELVAQGKSIIVISSELTEVLRLCDRIIVMCEGYKTGVLPIEEATQEKILALATERQGTESEKLLATNNSV